MITATYIDHMGSDLSVVNAARVSFLRRNVNFYFLRHSVTIEPLMVTINTAINVVVFFKHRFKGSKDD